MSAKKYTCLIADDEPYALSLSADYAGKISDLELVASCANAIEALACINSLKPQIVFLDIQMPEISGLELVRSLQGNKPAIVFTTAYPNYAAEGFNLEVADYLVKPFPFERFARAVNKIRNQLNRQPEFLPIIKDEDFLLVKSEKKMIRIDFKDLQEVIAQGDYVQIGSNQQKLVVHATLQEMEERLSAKGFVRISRSVIIGIHAIASMEGNVLMLMNNSLHQVGPVYRNKLMAVLTGRIV